jgi:hypothetical protein
MRGRTDPFSGRLLRLPEKERFLDGIKVFVCNLRAEMGRMLLEHDDRKKEVWPAVSMIVEVGGLVKLEEGRLQVTLRRFKDREIDYAARHLCQDLNRMSPVTLDRYQFPIRYEVQ